MQLIKLWICGRIKVHTEKWEEYSNGFNNTMENLINFQGEKDINKEKCSVMGETMKEQ